MPAYRVKCRCGRVVARGGAGFHRCVDGRVRLGWAEDAPGWLTWGVFLAMVLMTALVVVGAVVIAKVIS